MNVTWQLSDATIWLLCVNFAFNTVGLLCGVKVVARFYTVQYEHMKQDVTACAYVIVPNFLGVYLWRELAKLDGIWLSYSKYKKGDVFFWDTVYNCWAVSRGWHALDIICISRQRCIIKAASLMFATDCLIVAWSVSLSSVTFMHPSLLFLRVTCPCSLRTYATLKFIRSSSSSSSFLNRSTDLDAIWQVRLWVQRHIVLDGVPNPQREI